MNRVLKMSLQWKIQLRLKFFKMSFMILRSKWRMASTIVSWLRATGCIFVSGSSMNKNWSWNQKKIDLVITNLFIWYMALLKTICWKRTWVSLRLLSVRWKKFFSVSLVKWWTQLKFSWEMGLRGLSLSILNRNWAYFWENFSNLLIISRTWSLLRILLSNSVSSITQNVGFKDIFLILIIWWCWTSTVGEPITISINITFFHGFFESINLTVLISQIIATIAIFPSLWVR